MKREAADADSAAEDRAASRAMRRVSDWGRPAVDRVQPAQPDRLQSIECIRQRSVLPPPSPSLAVCRTLFALLSQVESKAQVAKRRREAQQEFLYTIPVTPQVGGGTEHSQACVTTTEVNTVRKGSSCGFRLC
jgi:hypothetical protein